MRASSDASAYQRNALLPGLIAAAILMLAAALVGTAWFTIVQFLVAILALIVTWFAVQARQWWWLPVFIAIAVLWNPVLPLPFSGLIWMIAQPLAATVFLVAGALIRQRRTRP
ncbi:DUF6804 family protein [Leucobacter sp. wl10]|uniref:DUF6804 family protein n=1 Tax=Leucobacter sp. wl10 TaxID=2304677 RepID=UPI000E5BFD24|nr:DUF6804 family protein [Leucobacter sp. wl10]RGE21464.1 hypothetical protein D1J51_06390 [Leucobacter sp. wl10]